MFPAVSWCCVMKPLGRMNLWIYFGVFLSQQTLVTSAVWCPCCVCDPAGVSGQDVQEQQSVRVWDQQPHFLPVQVRILWRNFPISNWSRLPSSSALVLFPFDPVDFPTWTTPPHKYRTSRDPVQSRFTVRDLVLRWSNNHIYSWMNNHSSFCSVVQQCRGCSMQHQWTRWWRNQSTEWRYYHGNL